MTDLFYYDLKNKVKIRAEKVKADEYWVKDPDNPGEYIPLTPGGGGGSGDELPYYAKPTKIDFLSDSLRTTVDHTGIEVDNTSDGTGSMLSPTGLTIGDTNGNESITKDKANCLTRVKALETAPEIITTTDAVETRPVVFNPTTKEFRQTSNISLLSLGGTYRTTMRPTSFGIAMPGEPGWASSMAIGGFTTGSPTHRFHAASTGTGVVFRNLSTNKGVTIRDSYIRVANMTGDTVSATGDYGSLGENNLHFRVDGVYYFIDREDIKITNKLKALTSASPGGNSRMLIFDTATKAFNYTTIPEGGGGSVPAWVQPTSANFVNAIDVTKTNTIDSDKILIEQDMGRLISIDPTIVSIENPASGRSSITPTKLEIASYGTNPSTSSALTRDSLTLRSGGVNRVFNWNRLDQLIKMEDAPAAVPSVGDKMLVRNGFDYRLLDIPDGVILPDYVKPNSIEFTNTQGKNRRMGSFSTYTHPNPNPRSHPIQSRI